MRNDQLLNTLRLISFQSMILEKRLDSLQAGGTNLGRNIDQEYNTEVDLDLFDNDIVSAAKRMANFYIVYYSFENYLRRFIRTRLREKYDDNWYDTKIPIDVKNNINAKMEKEKRLPWVYVQETY